MGKDEDFDSFFRSIKARLQASPSSGNLCGIDPDNPTEVFRHEREERDFFMKRRSLNARILYVHGFASSGESETADALRRYLPESRVISPDLPVDPDDALAMLKKIVREERIDCVVGSSMGGMLAQKLRGIPKVLVNPAFHVSESMRQNIGLFHFFNRRKDGVEDFVVTNDLCDAYRNVESGQFDNLTRSEIEMTYGVFGSDDVVVNCQAEYDRYYTNKLIYIGGHRPSSDAVHDYVVEAILRLVKKI